MTRPLEADTSTALDQPVIPLAIICRLDILDDPLFYWSGLGDLTFGASETGDTALDGYTFEGRGSLIEVGVISEGVGGSDAMELTLPGVNLQDDALKQIVYNANRWQFRRAWVWFMVLDPITNAIEGKPFRVKTGRMDQMPFGEDKGKGFIKCKIEGQQSYGNQPSYSRYSEQKEINPTDISQDYIYSLANMTADLGKRSAAGQVTLGGDPFRSGIRR